MKTFSKLAVLVLAVGCLAVLLSGCTIVLQKARSSDIEKLKMTEEELSDLKKAHAALEKSLKKEISAEEVSLGIEDRGLVITFVDSVLFDSGKAKLRREAHSALNKVAKVCRKTVADKEIGIEGHTDNQPIKHSGWKSNWELSCTRATSVLHYLVKKGVSGERLSATGFGEYRPVATNETTEAREKNRRVEIVILSQSVARAGISEGKYIK